MDIITTIVVYNIFFIIGFFATNFFIQKKDIFSERKELCVKKDSVVRLVNEKNCGKPLMREIKEYSLLKIRDGHFEYGDVLNSLTCKGKTNDKATKENEVNA